MWPFKKNDDSGDARGSVLPTDIDQHAMLDCPRCKVAMRKVTRNGVVIDFCGTCHGMWLDHGELGKLIDTHERQASEPKKPVGKASKKRSAKR